MDVPSGLHAFDKLIFYHRAYRKYNAIIQSGIPILKRYDIPGKPSSPSISSVLNSHICMTRASASS